MEDLELTLKKMKLASAKLAGMTNETKNKALMAVSAALVEYEDAILEANEEDLNEANKAGLPAPLIKRLTLNKDKLRDLNDGLIGLTKLADPCNETLMQTELDSGLILTKKSVPIGVIGVIFEARPDALVQITALCIKSGNCVVLKGGSEALHSNRILAKIITDAVCEVSADFTDTITLLETRDDVAKMLSFDKYINLIIPRGSNAFVQYIKKNSLIPVLGHADGICHIYVDKAADIDMAVRVVTDAKTQYVAVCNATETLLVHSEIAQKFLPALKKSLDAKHVTLKCDKRAKAILPDTEDATEEDWKTEYLDYILSIKVVDSVEEAVTHINTYGSGHTDGIITADENTADYFTTYVDTADAFVNCSTRFADGFRFGFGAEVGISTNKFHARGPVGIDGLVIYKYILKGHGDIVDDYATGKKHFTHKRLK